MVFSASLRTASATTAKPRPVSPTCRFNGRIQNRQAGLVNDVGNGIRDIAGALRLLAQLCMLVCRSVSRDVYLVDGLNTCSTSPAPFYVFAWCFRGAAFW